MNKLIANRGLLQIFFALLLVIIIMFVSTYVVYRNSISGIYDKVTENNSLVVKNIIQSFDSSFTAVNNLIFTIHGLPYGDLDTHEDGRIDMTKVYMLQNHIATLASSYDFIEDVVVFYDHSNLAITSKGTSDMNVLFHSNYRHEMYNAEYWRAFARTKHIFTVFPADHFAISAGTSLQRNRKLMIAMDGNKLEMSDKNIMVIINVDKLLNEIDRKAMIPGASLIVLDQNRNIILSTENDLDLIEVLNDVYFNPAREASLTRENIEYNFYKSNYNSFIYIDKVPYQFQNIGPVNSANLMIMISAIICAVLLAALLSIYLYRPVKDILGLLGGGVVKGNDFRKIYSGIVKVQTENESLKKQIDFVDTEIRRGVFLQMLDGHSHSREYEIQMQKYYPHFFKDRQFVMAVLQLKRSAESEQNGDLQMEDMTEMIQAGLQDSKMNSLVYHMSNLQFIALIGINQASDRKTVLDRLEAFIRHAEKDVFKGYSLWACVSRLYDSKITNSHAAYTEVMNGRVCRHVNPTRPIVDMETIRYTTELYFPFEKIEKLSNCLLSGKTNEGIRIVQEIMSENAERNIHHHQLAHVAKSIFFHMVQHNELSGIEARQLHQLEMDFCQRVDHAYDYKDMQTALIKALQFIASHRNQNGASKLNPAFIAQYIELHYMESLYLDHMAEVLDTSPKYFSNYFKKAFGVNYIEYLNKVKLSHAKEFLKNTDLSISEIGEKTGYLNSSTFTTTFKKYCGISPSEYRKKTGT